MSHVTAVQHGSIEVSMMYCAMLHSACDELRLDQLVRARWPSWPMMAVLCLVDLVRPSQPMLDPLHPDALSIVTMVWENW